MAAEPSLAPVRRTSSTQPQTPVADDASARNRNVAGVLGVLIWPGAASASRRRQYQLTLATLSTTSSGILIRRRPSSCRPAGARRGSPELPPTAMTSICSHAGGQASRIVSKPADDDGGKYSCSTGGRTTGGRRARTVEHHGNKLADAC
uniref:Uncharacterized protein n=1 Tax=Oryza rufipogon TaxID=4529 RepID=A0A0E0MVE6_ORYRU